MSLVTPAHDPGEAPLTDQPPAKPSDLIYEDTGAAAPLVYFDIVGAYGTMNGSVEDRAGDPHPGAEAGRMRPRSNSSPPAASAAAANAAINLRNGLDAALKMLEQPQGAARRRSRQGS